MAKSLEQVLGYVALTGLIQRIKSGIPNPLPEKFMTMTKDVIGDSGRYTQVTGQRKVARSVRYGAAALNRTLKDVAYRDAKLVHGFEQQNLPPLILQRLRQYDNYDLQRMGMLEVARQTKEFVQLFINKRVAASLFALSLGHIYSDINGELLPSSAGAVEDADFGMSANNQNQLNGIIAASWALSNTDIPSHIRNIKLQALKSTGYEIKYALYGINVPSYLTQNDYVIDYLARNPAMQTKFLESADVPSGLFGLQWIPVYLSFFEDQNDTNQTIVSGDTVIFTPEISDDWWEILQGSYTVPTTINIVADAAAAANSLKIVYGMAGYSQVTPNPPGIASFYLDTFLPTLKIPDAIFQADVVP